MEYVNHKLIFTSLKSILILLTLLILALAGNSQTDETILYKNIIHAEAGGIGGYGSLNYERMFLLPELFSASARIGLSTVRINDYTTRFNPDLLIPLTINGFYGKSHKIHLGFGQLITNTIRSNHTDGKPIRDTNLHTHFAIGYRYHKDGGRLVLGISYTPMIEFQETYRHWGGVTVGFVF